MSKKEIEAQIDHQLRNGVWQGVPGADLAPWEQAVLELRDAFAARWRSGLAGKMSMACLVVCVLLVLIGSSYLLGLLWPTFDTSL